MHQVCTRIGVHQVCTKCAPGVHQVCTRCAPGVHYLGVHHVFTVHQVCTRCAPGVHWGVHQVCTRCAELHYQIAIHLQNAVHGLAQLRKPAHLLNYKHAICILCTSFYHIHDANCKQQCTANTVRPISPN